MKVSIYRDKRLYRTDQVKLFKYSKQGILMRYKEGFINLSLMILEDRDSVLDLLYGFLDNDLTFNQRMDIKNVIKELIDGA